MLDMPPGPRGVGWEEPQHSEFLYLLGPPGTCKGWVDLETSTSIMTGSRLGFFGRDGRWSRMCDACIFIHIIDYKLKRQ